MRLGGYEQSILYNTLCVELTVLKRQHYTHKCIHTTFTYSDREMSASSDQSTSALVGQGCPDSAEDTEETVVPSVYVVLVEQRAKRILDDVTHHLEEQNNNNNVKKLTRLSSQSHHSDTNGQDPKLVHQRDSTGGTVWRETRRCTIDGVQTCTEERWWVYWEKDAEDGTTRNEEMGKA